MQDQALTESMGEIVDHTFENLAGSDLMITRTRRRILQAVRSSQHGVPAPGADRPETYQGARGGDFLSPNTVGWLEAYGEQMRGSKNPTGALKIAAE